MAKYTQTVEDFYKNLTQSWTRTRLTEDEKHKINNMRYLRFIFFKSFYLFFAAGIEM